MWTKTGLTVQSGGDVIVLNKFGSHLYGTNTPDSDLDIKGVFMPTKRQILLGEIPKNPNNSQKKALGEKNTVKDMDVEIYSLHYFLKLACQGQTVALDMLHTPSNMILTTSVVWNDLVKNRSKFYTKNLTAFVGYCRKQAAKYGIKGSRLDALAQLITLLEKSSPTARLITVWHLLPLNEHSQMVLSTPTGHMQYECCSRKVQETVRVEHALGIFRKVSAGYGARAEQAKNNLGIDWKAISHALRAAYEVREILTDGTITFPLKHAQVLKEVKCGEHDYLTVVAPMLEDLMAEVEELTLASDLPEEVDQEFWDNWLERTVLRYHFGDLWPMPDQP